MGENHTTQKGMPSKLAENMVAEEAEAAARKGATKTLYKFRKRLGHQKTGQNAHSRQPAKVSDELAAWREHFLQIQNGALEVGEAVWLNVPAMGSHPEVDALPTRMEFDQAIAAL